MELHSLLNHVSAMALYLGSDSSAVCAKSMTPRGQLLGWWPAAHLSAVGYFIVFIFDSNQIVLINTLFSMHVYVYSQ